MVSTTKSSEAKLSEMLSIFSTEVLPQNVRQKARKICDELDQLLFLDNFGELAVDRETLIKIASNEELVPAALRDIAILETSKHLGRRVKGLGKGHRINWREAEKYGVPIKPLQKKDFRAMGLPKIGSIEELGKALKSAFPEIPKFWMEKDSTKLRNKVIQSFSINRTVWDCLVANLGFWAALAILGSLVVFVCLLELGWQVALAIAAIYFGFATAYFVLQCIANPYYQA